MFQHRSFFNAEHCATDAERGFLPRENPLTELPALSAFNIRLNQVVRAMPDLIGKKTFRAAIDDLNKEFPDASISFEKSKPRQKQVATLLLTMLAQAYVWEDLNAPKNSIPGVIAKPLYELCKHQQRFPTLTYADYILYNWRLKNPQQGISLENIDPIFTITGTKDEAWFIKIHVVIEATAGSALASAYKAYMLANSMLTESKYQYDASTEKELIALFEKIQQSLQAATAVFKRMKEECQPDYFWNTLRLYLNGWEKVKSATAAEFGVRFEGVETRDKLPSHCYKGSSGAQSSIIPALDAALGVKHEINGMFQTLLAFKSYMPMEHQIFISVLSRGQISKVVKQSGSKALFSAWEKAVDQIKLFRMGHMGLVANYLHQPAAKTGIKREDIVGTGGTPIDVYLGSRHDATGQTAVMLKAKL